MDNIKCEDCDGSGRNVQLETTGRDDGGFTRSVDCGECTSCKGTGVQQCVYCATAAVERFDGDWLCEECAKSMHKGAEIRRANELLASGDISIAQYMGVRR